MTFQVYFVHVFWPKCLLGIWFILFIYLFVYLFVYLFISLLSNCRDQLIISFCIRITKEVLPFYTSHIFISSLAWTRADFILSPRFRLSASPVIYLTGLQLFHSSSLERKLPNLSAFVYRRNLCDFLLNCSPDSQRPLNNKHKESTKMTKHNYMYL
jgi:hypothetical protein